MFLLPRWWRLKVRGWSIKMLSPHCVSSAMVVAVDHAVQCHYNRRRRRKKKTTHETLELHLIFKIAGVLLNQKALCQESSTRSNIIVWSRFHLHCHIFFVWYHGWFMMSSSLATMMRVRFWLHRSCVCIWPCLCFERVCVTWVDPTIHSDDHDDHPPGTTRARWHGKQRRRMIKRADAEPFVGWWSPSQRWLAM